MSIYLTDDMLLASTSKQAEMFIAEAGDVEKGLPSKEQHPLFARLQAVAIIFLCSIMLVTAAFSLLALPIRIQRGNTVVASESAICTNIALNILKEGGNAVDAAIASTICLGVVNPCSSGIGGGAFILLRLPNGTVDFIDGREFAPHGITGDITGAKVVGVPGELRALELAHARYANLPWPRLLQPSIELANQGFLVGPYLARIIQDEKRIIHAAPHLERLFSKKNGHLVKEGDVLYRRDLGRTLERIAKEGVEVFYTGDIARDIVDTVNAHGGVFQLQDLSLYQAISKNPINASFINHRLEEFDIITAPDATGGPSVLFILNIMEQLRKTREIPSTVSPVALGDLVEAMKFAQGKRFDMGDGLNQHDVVLNMIDKTTAANYAARIVNNPGTLSSENYIESHFKEINENGTMHLSIIDKNQMAVSLTSTINLKFGSGLITPSGILLNNELLDFFINETEGPNRVLPLSRPLSSASPIIVIKDGQVHIVLGGAGGARIAPSVAQTLYWLLEYGVDLEKAIQQPRVFHQLQPNILLVEPGLSQSTMQHLISRGHRIGVLKLPLVMSVLQGIERDRSGGGEYRGYSDLRKGGFAKGITM